MAGSVSRKTSWLVVGSDPGQTKLQAARTLGLEASPGFPSPLKGPKGNQEYFLLLKAPGPDGAKTGFC